eukprot:m.287731 g.287731  ORF g.287731 m.287731 type:complete len:103 (+) comp19447_c0_seq1:116-424(+)
MTTANLLASAAERNAKCQRSSGNSAGAVTSESVSATMVATSGDHNTVSVLHQSETFQPRVQTHKHTQTTQTPTNTNPRCTFCPKHNTQPLRFLWIKQQLLDR